MREREQVIYRNLAIPLRVFDRIKDVQRRTEAKEGRPLTLMEAVAQVVVEHQQHEASEAHDSKANTAALLRS